MGKLTTEAKAFIVTALACFESPSDVAESVRYEFGVEVPRNRVQEYDASGHRRDRLAKKWQELFDETRRAFLEEIARIPIANKSVRLQRLERMTARTEKMGNIALAAQLLEQAAKECGGAYTNKREHSGPDGAPMSARLEVEFVEPGPD